MFGVLAGVGPHSHRPVTGPVTSPVLGLVGGQTGQEVSPTGYALLQEDLLVRGM